MPELNVKQIPYFALSETRKYLNDKVSIDFDLHIVKGINLGIILIRIKMIITEILLKPNMIY